MAGRNTFRPTRTAVCLAWMLAIAPAASAHAFLEHASPGVGSTVAAPAELRLTFTERVEPLFSRVTVRSPAGTPLPAGRLETARNGQQLVVKLPKLAPGTYTVQWHVTSVDTHKTQGSFRFTVQPGS